MSEPYRVFCDKHDEHKARYTDRRPLLDDTCPRCLLEVARAETARLQARLDEGKRRSCQYCREPKSYGAARPSTYRPNEMWHDQGPYQLRCEAEWATLPFDKCDIVDCLAPVVNWYRATIEYPNYETGYLEALCGERVYYRCQFHPASELHRKASSKGEAEVLAKRL